MSVPSSPLSDSRGGTLTWDLVEPFASINLTVQRVLPPATTRGVEHDLCALMALLEMNLDESPQQSLIGVQTALWTVGLCCNGRLGGSVEREVCKRLKRLGHLIDPAGSAK